jgi:hypothetical protein
MANSINKSFSNISPITSNNSFDGAACPITDEIKQQNFKYSLSKFERDLYYDEDNTINKIIRVKRFTYPNSGEKWKIFEDNKIHFIVDGAKLTRREKEFLRSVEGINFLIAQYKEGLKYITHLKNKIREYFKALDK